MTNILTDIIVRDQGVDVMRFVNLSREDADWYMATIATIPGRSINRVEHF